MKNWQIWIRSEGFTEIRPFESHLTANEILDVLALLGYPIAKTRVRPEGSSDESWVPFAY